MAIKGAQLDAESQTLSYATESAAKSMIPIQQAVQDKSGPRAAMSVEQATKVMLSSATQTEKNTAAKIIADAMRSVEYLPDAILQKINLLDESGKAAGYLIKIGEFEKAKQLMDKVGTGEISNTKQLNQQMDKWGYHDFVIQQQSTANQYDAIISMIAGSVLMIAAAAARQFLENMRGTQDEEQKKELKKKLDEQLGEAGVKSIEVKEKIAETGSAALKKDGSLTDDGMGKIISEVVAANAENMRLRFSNTAFSDISNTLTRNHDPAAIEFANVSPEVRHEFNRLFDPNFFSTEADRAKGAVTLLKQIQS